jgi:hypothetical protein
VQDHVHPSEAGGRVVFLLPIQCHTNIPAVGCLVAHLQQERPRTAGRIVNRGVGGGPGVANAQNLRDDAAHFGGGIKLALALPALRRKVSHKVFVGVAKKVVAVGAVRREIEGGIFKNGDEVGKPLDHLLAAAELIRIVEVRHIGQLIRMLERPENLFIDLVADVGLALERDHVGKACAFGEANGRVVLAGVAVTHVFHEEQHQDVVLVLAGIHAAAQFVARGPEGGIEFGFFECHSCYLIVIDSCCVDRSPPGRRSVHLRMYG